MGFVIAFGEKVAPEPATDLLDEKRFMWIYGEITVLPRCHPQVP